MSVLLSKRRESKMQFIMTALDVQSGVFDVISRLSVRYQRIFCDKLGAISIDLVESCELANAIAISSTASFEKRDLHFRQALGDLHTLDVMLAAVFDILRLNPEGCFHGSDEKHYTASEANAKLDTMILRIGGLIDDEERLIRGVMKADKEKFKATSASSAAE